MSSNSEEQDSSHFEQNDLPSPSNKAQNENSTLSTQQKVTYMNQRNERLNSQQRDEGMRSAESEAKPSTVISQNQTQQHQYTAHYTSGTAAETQVRKPQELSALDRLKSIQATFKRTWTGIDCGVSGRAGTSNFVNKKRHFTIPETFIEEEERQRTLSKVFSKIRELEDDRYMATGNTQNSTTSFNKTLISSQNSGFGNFFTTNNATTTSRKDTDFLNFKLIKESQLVTHSQPFTGYQKSYHIENSELLYKMLRFDNKLIRSVLEANGFSHTESHEWNILWSSSSCKSYLYEGLNEYQKINHFPQSYEITRKDRLCYNMVRMQERYGKQNFDFIPDTYILPDEFGDFYAHYQKLKQHDSKKNVWIVKPANSSQGKGIYIVDDINDVSVDDTSVISRYVTNPLLINGHKFDLRIYVLVTCYEPMRIYIFQEGLARFASETYTSKINKNNKYMHLTNYSINKKNDNFVQNENAEQDDYGFKWSLSAFCKHLEQVGIDMNLLWSRINDVLIKTIICGEHHVMAAMKKNGTHRTNCFEVFGFDILIDSDLKPWLLEVNLSPSLATDAPLDMTIKSNLMTDVFNLVGVKKFDRKKESLNKIKHRMKGYNNKQQVMKKGFGGGIQGTSLHSASQGGNEILHQATGQQIYALIDRYVQENPAEFGHLHEALRKGVSLRQKDYLRETLNEYSKKGNFIRIYPAKGSDIYDCYFNQQRPYNKLIYKVLYTDEVLSSVSGRPTNDLKLQFKVENPVKGREEIKVDEYKSSSSKEVTRLQPQIMKERPNTGHPGKLDLLQQQPPSVNSSLTQTTKNSSGQVTSMKSPQEEPKQEKVLITGDDILIDYVERLMLAVRSYQEDALLDSWRVGLDTFINHYVWHQKESQQGGCYWQRLEGRLQEMQERRRRLIKYLYKKEGRLHEFEEGFKQSIAKKSQIIKKFSSIQLEDLLRTSTKNVAQEVVSSLIPTTGGIGLLGEIDTASRRPVVKRPIEELDTSGSSRTAPLYQRQSKSAQGSRSLPRRPQENNYTNTSATRVPARPQIKRVV